jgi:hypothetical protein
MEATAGRSFTIADGMILVAAAGLALADLGLDHMVWEPTWQSVHSRLAWAWFVFTVALVPIRLLRPRPGRDDFWRQPGWIACSSVSIAMGALVLDRSLWVARFAFRAGKFRLMYANVYVWDFVLQLDSRAMLIVAAAWGVLVLSGRWRAEPSWIDRLGRLIGLGWIVLRLADWAAN